MHAVTKSVLLTTVLLSPGCFGDARETRRRSDCANELRHLVVELRAYMDRHDDFPRDAAGAVAVDSLVLAFQDGGTYPVGDKYVLNPFLVKASFDLGTTEFVACDAVEELHGGSGESSGWLAHFVLSDGSVLLRRVERESYIDFCKMLQDDLPESRESMDQYLRVWDVRE